MPKKIKHFKINKRKSKDKNIKLHKLNQIEKLINSSKRPLILVGNGCLLSNSIKKIKNLINKYKIPYAASWATLHCFSSKDKLNSGTFGVAASRYGNFAVQKADLIICLGLRLSSQIIGGNIKNFAPKAKKILIEIDKDEFTSQRLPKIDVKINVDVKKFLNDIKKINIQKRKPDNWISKINYLKKKYPVVSKNNLVNNKYVDPYYFFKEFYSKINKNSVVIPDASANLIWAYQTFKSDKKPEMFTAFNHSPMGYSLAASVGSFFGNKMKKTYALIGDGSVPMNVQELETIKNYNVNVVIIVINNQGYGLIKQTQETWLKSNYAGVDKKSGLSLPDNTKIADSYGVKNFTLKNNDDVKNNLKKILNMRGPVLIDVKVDPKSRVKPKIEFGKPLHDMYPYLEKNEINSIMND